MSFVPQQPLLGELASGFNAASPCGDDPGCSFPPTIGNFDSQPGATGNGEVRPRGNSSRLGLISECYKTSSLQSTSPRPPNQTVFFLIKRGVSWSIAPAPLSESRILKLT